jgi:hypothetical protein
MHTRRIVVAIGIATAIGAGALLLNGWRFRADPVGPISVVDFPRGGFRMQVPPERPRPDRFGDAQLCLIDTVSCLELASDPFAPCLLAVERCSGEWRVHPLVGRNAD